MPTKHRRRAIAETPSIRAALMELQKELGEDRVELGELVLLGANAKLAELRAEQGRGVSARRRLADRIRARDLPVSQEAADEVRASGWARA
jgi:hypothetical protein